MPENFELLESGQIEIMHDQVHNRFESDEGSCDELRMQHDSLAAELVKRGIAHDTEIICAEIETNAPNFRRGFTDEVCTNCAFGQLFPFCNLYKFDYLKGYTCDSFRYFEVLELEIPHGFLMANGKQTAIAGVDKKEVDKPFLIISGGEVFGIAEFEPAVQIKTKEFDGDEWVEQHRTTPRERRQWWGDAETFYVYRLKEWIPYEGIKLYEDGKVIDEPKLTAKQWEIVSKSKGLPKQITLLDNAVAITDRQEFIIDQLAECETLKNVLAATYEADIKDAERANEIIPIYSLALVRNPRMRVSKKNIIAEKQEEGEAMPFRIRERDGEFCVVKINPDDSDGDVSGCHNTREEAEAQLTALNINVTAEESESAVHNDKPKKRKPKKKEAITTGFSIDDKLVAFAPERQQAFDQIDKGIAEGKIEVPEDEGNSFMAQLRSLGKSISNFLKSAETEQDEPLAFETEAGIAQKTVNGELWHFTWSTNAFEDREGEIFSTKSLEDYVAANEINEDKGFFNLWHINAEDGNFNTDFAVKRWQGVIGRFLVEAGPYLEDGKGRAAKEFFKQFPNGHSEIAPEGWGCSPEYKYLPEERLTKIYKTIWITRTSTLPRMAAANIWTETRQLARSKMALTDVQMKAAVEFFGESLVNNLIEEGQNKTAELEAANVAHKGNDDKPEPGSEAAQVSITQDQFQVLAEEIAKQFQVNNESLVEALSTMANGLKEIGERVDQLEEKGRAKGLAETPSFTFNLQRASEQSETIVAEDDKLKDQRPKETGEQYDASTITPAQFFGTR